MWFQFLLSNSKVTQHNMGITESKIIIGKLTTACSVAEQNGQSQVQHILSDKQVGNSSPKFSLSLIIDSLSIVLQNSGSTCLNVRKRKFIHPVGSASKTDRKSLRPREYAYLSLCSQTLICGQMISAPFWIPSTAQNTP